MSSFFIRKATRADVSLIIKFIQAIAEYEKLSDQVQATEENINRYLFSDQAVAGCLLGFENETCVGFALYFNNFSTFVSRPGIYLEDLFVDPEFRGKGYGKKLLLELVRIAAEKNFGRVEWSVLNWNTPAIEFYKSLGAVPMNEWTIFRLDEWQIKQLSQSQNN